MLPAKWPTWIVIVIGFALLVFAVASALLLEPLAQTLSPELTPTPTIYFIKYARQISHGCEDCHFDRQALTASADAGSDLDAAWIEPQSLAMVHGPLGCVTCHEGDGETDDKTTAHEGLIVDVSLSRPLDCIVCHTELPEVIPGDRLRTPHKIVLDKIEHGEVDLPCSDCHGGVGHGFDPVSGEVICSMTVCQDCHEQLSVDIQMTDCEGCHIGPHDVSAGLSCDRQPRQACRDWLLRMPHLARFFRHERRQLSRLSCPRSRKAIRYQLRQLSRNRRRLETDQR